MKGVSRIPSGLNTSGGYRPACIPIAAIAIMVAVLVYSPADAAPVAVRFPEGVIHGFLLVRSLAGEAIGQAEITQLAREGGLVESHLVIRLKDGTLHDEKVVYPKATPEKR